MSRAFLILSEPLGLVNPFVFRSKQAGPSRPSSSSRPENLQVLPQFLTDNLAGALNLFKHLPAHKAPRPLRPLQEINLLRYCNGLFSEGFPTGAASMPPFEPAPLLLARQASKATGVLHRCLLPTFREYQTSLYFASPSTCFLARCWLSPFSACFCLLEETS